MQKKQAIKLSASVILSATVLAGCATTGKNPADPWEDWNRHVYKFNQRLDENVMQPVAKGYEWAMPSFVRTGVNNFFRNINDISVLVNDLLQGKLMQSGEDTARFLLNSTVGLGGLFDIASEVDLPKHNEDFDQTLAVWGIPSGPYLMLPLFGPSSARGVVGLAADSAMNPINYFTGPIAPPATGTVNLVDKRANNLAGVAIIKDSAVNDEYEYFRDTYLTLRQQLILDDKGETNPDFDIDKELEQHLKEEKH